MNIHYVLRGYYKSVIDSLPKLKIDCHDLTICLNGKMTYEVENKKYTVSSGDVIYMNPGTVRRRFELEDNCRYVSINLYGDSTPILDKTVFKDVLNQECMSILDKIENAYHTNEYEKIVLLTLYLVLEIRSQEHKQNEDIRITKIKSFVNNNIYAKLNSKVVATAFGYTAIYLESLFKKHTGKTITQFILERKINTAIQHMTYEQKTLSSIAIKLNFDDYNYFSRCFKKVTGMPPKKYLKIVKKSSFYPTVPI